MFLIRVGKGEIMKLIADSFRYIFYRISGKKFIPFGYRIPSIDEFKKDFEFEYIRYFDEGYFIPGGKNIDRHDPVWVKLTYSTSFNLPFIPKCFIKKGFVRVKL